MVLKLVPGPDCGDSEHVVKRGKSEEGGQLGLKPKHGLCIWGIDEDDKLGRKIFHI